jgi:hypothetical protein
VALIQVLALLISHFLMHMLLKASKTGGTLAKNARNCVKEGPLTKNGPIDFAQSWAIHMKKSN